MLIAQFSDLHIRLPGQLAYRQVDTAAMLRKAVEHLMQLSPRPDALLITGDLVDFGTSEEYAYLATLLAPVTMPIYALPGNHDGREAFRAAFGARGYLPRDGFLQFALDLGPLRLIGLDTLVEGQGGGALCEDRLAWLEATLREAMEMPTLLALHHPPFATGIAHMDRIGLEGAQAFAAIVERHAQIEAIVCGHVHRVISTTLSGRRALIAPSVAHQVALDLNPDGPDCFVLEPPGYYLHHWDGARLVTHTAFIGDFAGPYPFRDAQGRLID